jgi:LPXTG-motif cell wall-anchored protein
VIPDICVQWEDGHYSRLWTAENCTPQVPESTEQPTTVAPAVTPGTQAAVQLPATGAENWVIAAIAVGLIVAGGALLRARKF